MVPCFKCLLLSLSGVDVAVTILWDLTTPAKFCSFFKIAKYNFSLQTHTHTYVYIVTLLSVNEKEHASEKNWSKTFTESVFSERLFYVDHGVLSFLETKFSLSKVVFLILSTQEKNYWIKHSVIIKSVSWSNSLILWAPPGTRWWNFRAGREVVSCPQNTFIYTSVSASFPPLPPPALYFRQQHMRMTTNATHLFFQLLQHHLCVQGCTGRSAPLLVRLDNEIIPVDMMHKEKDCVGSV